MNDSQLTLISTAGDVIDALGGTAAAAKMLGTKAALQSISNARARNRLPSSTFLLFTDELARVGKRAPPALWGIKPPRRRR
jgi:hypothetical protein